MPHRSSSTRRASAAVLVAAVVCGCTVLLGPVPPAAAATASVPCPPGEALGLPGLFSEFILGDAQRMSDSEGRVAYGGTATLGDPAAGIGFSVGSGQAVDSVAEPLPNDPDRNDLIVGGQLRWFDVIVQHGSIRYGSAAEVGGFLDHPHGVVSQGAPEAKVGGPTFSFTEEFATLRSKSNSWSLLAPNGTVAQGPPPGQTGSPSALTLTGSDTVLNVFALTAAQLNASTEIWLKVPAGSTTLVNVSGQAVDLAQGPMAAVYIWDPVTGRWIIDDHYINGMPMPSVQWLTIRQSLLWNMPDVTSFLKDYVSWPGTILAPRAAVELGRGNTIGPGQIDGSLIAASVTSAPGAETHDMVFVGCLPPVPSEKGAVKVVKELSGEAAGSTTTFGFVLDCDGTLDDRSFTIDVVPPATQAELTIDDLPSGATCVLAETSVPAGWSLSSLTPHSVVVPGSGQDPAVFTVVNSRNTGYVRVIKALSGDTIGADRAFTLQLSCPAAGIDRNVELTVPLGSSSAFVDVGPIPTGVTCTLSEPTVPDDWQLASISPSSVVVGSNTVTPVEVTATNSRRLGDLRIRKVATGDTPPASSQFEVHLDCEGPAYDRTVTLGIPSPSEVTITNLPVGMNCTVTEPHLPAGWTNVSISPDPVTVGTSTVDVTVTNDYASGSIRVIKQLDGNAPADATFTVSLDCDGTGFDQDLSLTVSSGTDSTSQVVSGLPEGARCRATETSLPAGYGFSSVVPADGVVVGDGTTVDITVNNDVTVTPASILVVRKELEDAQGAPTPALQATTFTVRLSNCTNSVPDTDVTVVVGAGDTEAESQIALPEGTRCDVSEVSVPAGWSEVSVVPSQIDMAAPPVVTEVVATNVQQVGSLAVTKVVTGEVPTEATSFPMHLSCNGGVGVRSFEVGTATHLDIDVTPVVAGGSTGATVVIDDLPVGLECTLSEPFPPTGYTLSSIEPAVQVVAASPTVNTITVTNQLRTGSVALTKVLQAPSAEPSSFEVFLDCDGTAGDVLETLDVPAGSTSATVTRGDLPAGTTCHAAEVHQAGWSLVSTYPASVTVTAGGTSTVTVTNASEGGVVTLTKTVQGATSPAATTFAMTLACGTAAAVSASVVVPAGSTGSTNLVTGLPEGATCTVAEPVAPDLWQLVEIRQSAAPTDGAEAPPAPVVVNTMPTGDLVVTKTIQGGTPSSVLGFDFPIDCTDTAWDRTVRVHLDPGASSGSATVGGQPTGLSCTVTETPSSGWTLASAASVRTSPGGAAAAFVNTADTGSEVPLAFTGASMVGRWWWGAGMLLAGIGLLAVRPVRNRLRPFALRPPAL